MLRSNRASKLLSLPLAVAGVLAAADAGAQRGGPQRQIVQVAGDVYRANNGNWWSIFMVTPEGIVLALGALLGLGAFGIGLFVQKPSVQKLGELAAAL